MKKYSAILFDLDGTLLDTSEGVLDAIDYTIESLKLQPLTLEEKLSFIGPPIFKSFERVFGMNPQESADAAGFWRDYYSKHTMFRARIYDGIPEILQFLNQHNIKVGVATYKREDYAMQVLEHFNLSGYFDSINGADAFGKLTKTDVIKNCIRDLNIACKDEVLMFGDSNNDANGATEAGVDFVAALYGFGFKTPNDLTDYSHVGYVNNPMDLVKYI